MQNGSVNNGRSADTQSAALRGAVLAFTSGKPPIGPKPKPKPNTEVGVGNNDLHHGALAAATKVGGPRQLSRMSTLSATSGEDLRLSYQNTGSSVGGGSYAGGSVQQRLNRLSRNGLLQPPGTMGDGGRSASFIAATLAASRSPSVSPNPTGQQVESRKGFTRSPSVKSGSSSSELVDATPVPPTKGLIGMFEGNVGEGTMLPLKRSDTSATVKKPPRRVPSQTSIQQRSASPMRNEPQKPPKPEIKSSKPSVVRPKSEYLPSQSKTLGPPVPKRKPSIPTSKPIPIPTNTKSLRPSQTLPPPEDDASSEDSFVSASSQHTEPALSPDLRPSFRAALAQRRHLTSTSVTSLPSTTATIDSMANAIVASSIASSRAASPSKSKYPPLPPARKTGRNHIFHHPKDPSRTPSPAKQVGMKTTLRKVKSKDSIDEGEKRRTKKSLVKKHPHKHHEGDRKRWRDSITERERKRYEAVWASNRGLWLRDEESDRVCSLVVKDVWSRSRLHADVLEEVYALVDRSGVGSLEREEFVIGMWLVDQWLRGRKLPVRVGESVWRSVGATGGIKIHGPKVKK